MAKRVAIIIAFREFRDEEYFIPKEILESEGIEITTVSSEKGIAIGKLGGEADVDIVFNDLKVSDFDAVIFCGGSGAVKLIDNKECHRIARDALKENKVLAAICSGPAILAKAGVLSGKKASVWSIAMDKSLVKILNDSGAVYKNEPVVKDGNIITASGPSSAEEFAREILITLNSYGPKK